MVNIKAIFFSVLIAAFFSLVFMLILYSLPANIWVSWTQASCLSSGCFCEAADNHGTVKQIVNTWSSLAFVFTGFIVLGVTMLSPKINNDRLINLYAYMIGLAAILTGSGSAFYHASLTFTGQLFDILGMYLLATLMLVYAWERIYQWRVHQTILVYLFLNIFLTVIQIIIPDTRRYVFAIILVLALIFEYVFQLVKRPKILAGKLNWGVGLFAFAYIIWILDNTKIACAPASLFQGHALWHILGAIAVGFLFQYYSSEKRS